MRKLRIVFWSILQKLPVSGNLRAYFVRKMGVRFRYPDGESPHVFVGEGVVIDKVCPENIEIGQWTTIATNTIILSHFMDSKRTCPGFSFNPGKVKIGNAVFVGASSIICNQCTIGDNAIIGAGSVVTKDIPSGEIWGGNPARFIKKRPLKVE